MPNSLGQTHICWTFAPFCKLIFVILIRHPSDTCVQLNTHLVLFLVNCCKRVLTTDHRSLCFKTFSVSQDGNNCKVTCPTGLSIRSGHGQAVYTQAKKNNLVFRATVFKTLGRVGSVFFLRIEASIIKTSMKKKSYFRKKSLGSAGSNRQGRVA